MGVSETFVKVVRKIVGLPADPTQPPDLMRLGLYPARVDNCASDGSTCDVTPTDKRISAEKNVTVRVGIPGAVAVVSPGAIVLLGWERGDPGAPFCIPAWSLGATITKLEIGSSPDAVATKADLDAIKAAINGAAVGSMDGGATFKANIILAWPVAVGSTVVKVQR